MGFGTNKTFDSFSGTCSRDNCSSAIGKRYKNSWVEFKELNGIDNQHYSSNHYDYRINKYGVKYGTSIRFCLDWFYRSLWLVSKVF